MPINFKHRNDITSMSEHVQRGCPSSFRTTTNLPRSIFHHRLFLTLETPHSLQQTGANYLLVLL
jgi:hypothetical protein